MRKRIAQFFRRRPYAAGVASTLLLLFGAASVAAASGHIRPLINGSVVYVNNTAQAVIEGIQLGGGIGVEGVTDTGSPAGAIALDGFGTSTTHASVGVNGSVDGPGSTALIGNANDLSGAASIGLEGFSQNGEGVFAEGSAGFPSLRSVDSNLFYDVRLSDLADSNGVTSLLATCCTSRAVVGDDTNVATPLSDVNIGVLGETATGLVGVEGTAGGNASAGVEGIGNGSPIGVYGTSTTGDAVFAISTSGAGVLGESSTNNNGIQGETFNPSATTSVAESGVEGIDESGDGGTLNFGVEGSSTHGVGVFGTTTSGLGLLGESSGNIGILGESGASAGVLGETATDVTFGVEGVNFSSDPAGTGGVLGSDSVGSGVWGTGEFALVGECANAGGDELYLADDTATENYFVDCTGFQGLVVRGRHANYAVATTPKSTMPVLEDYGQAQLVNGAASVRLDPAFAETITDRAPYLVFVTPDGDTNGLYVTNKTTTGFQVREVRGGHSSLTFDYRIVAKPAGDNHPRMALMAQPPRALGHARVVAPALHFNPDTVRIAQIAKAKAHDAKLHSGKAALALSMHQRQPKRLPIYEPRMGPNGVLRPGAPYHPSGPNTNN
jgi:hypothetical protein